MFVHVPGCEPIFMSEYTRLFHYRIADNIQEKADTCKQVLHKG